MSEESLQQKVFSGLFWKFGERIGAQLVSFIVRIVLARLLSPSDFGVIVLITVFIDIANVFVSSGFGSALIQKKEADQLDFSSVFYFSIVMSWIFYAIVFLGAPLVASFYGKDILCPVLRVLALKIPLAGVNSVQQAYVQKKMLFKRFFFSTLIGTAGSAVVGIVMAYMGFGPWALVAQYLFNSTLDTLILWFTVKWRPIWAFSGKRMKELFSFGWKMLCSELIHTSYGQIRSLIIGKVYTEKDLGFYNQGGNMPRLVVTNINSSVTSVFFPAMSMKQDDLKKMKEVVRLSIRISSYVMWPLMIGLMVMSAPVVSLIYSDKWLPCVPFIMEIVKKVFGIAMILLVMYRGVMAIAWTAFIVTLFAAVVNSTPNRKFLNYNYKEQLADLIPSILLASVMGVCVYFTGMIALPTIVTVILQVIVGAAVYILLSILFRFSQFTYILQVLKNFTQSFRKGKKKA